MALMEHVGLVPSVRSRKARSTIAASQFRHLLRKITHTGIDSAVALAQTGQIVPRTMHINTCERDTLLVHLELAQVEMRRGSVLNWSYTFTELRMANPSLQQLIMGMVDTHGETAQQVKSALALS